MLLIRSLNADIKGLIQEHDALLGTHLLPQIGKGYLHGPKEGLNVARGCGLGDLSHATLVGARKLYLVL